MNNPTNPRCRHRKVVITIVLTIAIPVAYFAAYFAALEGKVYRGTGVDAATGINRHAIEPSFRIFDTKSNSFLRPALWVDRHIRHEYWNTIENSLTGKKWRNP